MYSIQHRKYTFDNSLTTNPYFFFAPFAGIGVSNAAHTFIRTFALSSICCTPTPMLIEISGLDVQSLRRVPEWHTGQGNPQILLRNHRSSRRHLVLDPWLRAYPRQLVLSHASRSPPAPFPKRLTPNPGTAAPSAPSTDTALSHSLKTSCKWSPSSPKPSQ